ELVRVLDLLRGEELHPLGEDARHVRVALEAVLLDEGENPLHLPLVVDVLGEDVLVERVAGLAVDVKEAVLPMATGPFGQIVPPLFAESPGLGSTLELGSGPENGLLGRLVEPVRVEHGAL